MTQQRGKRTRLMAIYFIPKALRFREKIGRFEGFFAQITHPTRLFFT
jgi:hypothetical protein